MLPRDSLGSRIVPPGALEWLLSRSRLRAAGMAMPDICRFAHLVRKTGLNDPGMAEKRLAILFRHRDRLLARRVKIEVAARPPIQPG